jgi:thymidylate synthase (FAD)
MKVKLISYSQPAEEMIADGVDDVQEMIAFCARVSNPANQINSETSKKLLNYLIKHKHWSPLEMASATLEIETTRDIARQILRHRSFSFQEFSQRYAEVGEGTGLGFVRREARLQDPKNRQNSISLDEMQPEPANDFYSEEDRQEQLDQKRAELEKEWLRQQDKVVLASHNAYKWALENGIAKEQARAVLPEGLTESRMYMNGTLRSWIHYIELRAANGTQKEHMEIARECAKVIAKIFPMAEELVGE